MAAKNPRKLNVNRKYHPVTIDKDDEIFRNGGFQINITKLLSFIAEHPEKFSVEDVTVNEYRRYSSENLDKSTIENSDISKPIVLGEIAPGRFNVIDGNHRLEKAGRDGQLKIPGIRVMMEQHVPFITSVEEYRCYAEYWNSKLRK